MPAAEPTSLPRSREAARLDAAPALREAAFELCDREVRAGTIERDRSTELHAKPLDVRHVTEGDPYALHEASDAPQGATHAQHVSPAATAASVRQQVVSSLSRFSVSSCTT
jgi:hypothetical protein